MNIILTINNHRLLNEEKKIFNYIKSHNGIDCVRFNASKIRDYDEYFCRIKHFQTMMPDIKIIIDIPYPKEKYRIYFSDEKNILKISKGEIFKIQHTGDRETKGKNNVLRFEKGINFQVLDESLDQEIIVGDGEGVFKVHSDLNDYTLEAMNAFELINGKAVHFPNKVLKKGEFDFEYIKLINPYAIMLSFVEKEEELILTKKKLGNRNIKIFSKIETASGAQNIRKIQENSDGIVVARGDLFLYSPNEMFYSIEKTLINSCKNCKTPVYIATDILDSIKIRKLPSRADIIDLSFLIENSVDGVILSAGDFSIDYAINLINKIEEYIKNENNKSF